MLTNSFGAGSGAAALIGTWDRAMLATRDEFVGCRVNAPVGTNPFFHGHGAPSQPTSVRIGAHEHEHVTDVPLFLLAVGSVVPTNRLQLLIRVSNQGGEHGLTVDLHVLQGGDSIDQILRRSLAQATTTNQHVH
jgi:hypothetical protein